MQKAAYEFISKQTNDPIVEWKTCKRCSDEFAITQMDLDALDKISPILAGEKKLIPPPKLCPDCRKMRRLMFRNERKLYRRKCDSTGKLMVSMFAPEADVIAYDPKIRNEDGGGGEKYGKDPDFSRSFLEQFREVSKKVPKRILQNAVTMENCEYSNYGLDAKDCYLSSGTAFSERCHYSYTSLRCLEDMDGYINISCQYVYECVQCLMGYKLAYSNFSISCKDSAFLFDCVNCDSCFACVNLVGKKHCFMNKQLSTEEYQSKVDAIMGSHQAIEKFKKEFNDFVLQFPKAATRKTKTENCIGNNITNASNCVSSYTVLNDAQDCKYCFIVGEKANNLHDCYQTGAGSQWLYEVSGCVAGYKSAFILGSDSVDSYYTEWTIDRGGSSHLFLCSGIKHKNNMLLNKIYEHKEREELIYRVIKKMEADGERGEYLSPTHSPYPLNDAVAMEYFPINKIIYPDGKETIFHEKGRGTVTVLEPEKFISKAVLDLGGEKKIDITWRTKDIDVAAPEGMNTIPDKDIPDNIKDVDDSILKKAIICEVSGRPYRLIQQELDFYREHNIPIPRKHYETRYFERIETLPPMQLFLRNCDKCGTECLAVYDEKYPGKVYCEGCYNKEIYG